MTLMDSSKNITIYDIATELNISPSTVSRALANSDLISDKMRNLEYAKAVEMGYKSKSFRLNTEGTVAVVVPELNNYFYSQVLDSIQKTLGDDILLSIYNSFNSVDNEIKLLSKLNPDNVCCLIIVKSMDSKDSSHIQEVEKRVIPIIMFNRVDYDYLCPKFVIDNYMDGYLLTKHLIASKYRRIAFVSKHYKCPIYKERARAYIDVLNDSGLRFNSDYMLFSEHTPDDIVAVVQRFLFSKQRPDAIIMPGFSAALQAISICRKYNINVPEEIAIVSFDEDPECRYSNPTITGIERPIQNIGKEIGEMAKRIYDNKPYDRNTLRVFKSNLIVRGSSLRKTN